MVAAINLKHYFLSVTFKDIQTIPFQEKKSVQEIYGENHKICIQCLHIKTKEHVKYDLNNRRHIPSC